MKVIVLDVCQKELTKFPKEILEDFVDAVAKLSQGLQLSMPLSKPMPIIGKNVHELRFRDKSGSYRILYLIRKKDAIYMIHAFHKKAQQTPKTNIDLTKKRIRRIL